MRGIIAVIRLPGDCLVWLPSKVRERAGRNVGEKLHFQTISWKPLGTVLAFIEWNEFIVKRYLFPQKKTESKGQSFLTASYRNYLMVGEYLIELIIEKLNLIKYNNCLSMIISHYVWHCDIRGNYKWIFDTKSSSQ